MARVPSSAHRPGSAWRGAYLLAGAVADLALILAASAATWRVAPEGQPLVSFALFLDPIACLTLAAGLWALSLYCEQVSRYDLAWVLLLTSALCAAGRWAAEGSPDGTLVYLLLLLWTGPSLTRFHQESLEYPQGCVARALELPLALASVGLSVPLVLWRSSVLIGMDWYPVWRSAVCVPLSVSAGLSALTLFVVRVEGWAEARQKSVRVIWFGLAVSLSPGILLSILPQWLGAPFYLPLAITAPFALLLPIFYLHALLPTRQSSGKRLRYVSVALLAATTLVTATLMLAVLLSFTALPVFSSWPFLLLVLAVLAGLARRPLWNVFMRVAEEAWLGRGANYTQVVGRLAESLSATLEPEALQRALVHRLARAMYVSWISLYLRSDTATCTLAGSHGLAPTSNLSHRTLPAGGALAQFLTDWARPATHEHVRRAVFSANLEPAEAALLDIGDIRLWVPIVAGGMLHGILLIGPRPGGESFSREDMQILTTLGQQSGVAIQNTRLMMEVQAGREELARAHQQLLDAGEHERLALAQELHDGAVQQLIGVSYQLEVARRAAARRASGEGKDSAEPTRVLEATRQEVLEVVTQLRGLIGELRPPGLEDLGLIAALESYVQRVESDANGRAPQIARSLDVDDRLIPQGVALCLFRVAQEGLRNVMRHAQASHVDLRLTLYGGYVELRLTDDGRGFVVPDRLSEMAAQNHFGLVSMAERVARVRGLFNITSAPGAGTEIRVQVALGEEDHDDGAAYTRIAG